MKRIKLLGVIALCAMLSCQKEDRTTIAPNKTTTLNNGGVKMGILSTARMASSGPFSQWITISNANEMINSYLTSINYPANDSALNSLIFNADSLRNYLSDPRIKQVKFIFAHTMEYINAGYYGVNAGYQTGELTMIVAGFDASGNYIYNNQGMVLDHAQPCPIYCGNGDAASPTLK